jgi:pyruvate dehydrogenase E1 component alpha subunit
VYSPLKVRQPDGRKISNVAKAMGLEVTEIDGNNPIDTYNAISKAVDKIKKYQEPQLIEFSTYRWLEHCGVNYDNHIGYRTVEEYNYWKGKDPILSLREILTKNNILDEAQYQELVNKLSFEINEAFHFAKESPFPDSIEAYNGEYAF